MAHNRSQRQGRLSWASWAVGFLFFAGLNFHRLKSFILLPPSPHTAGRHGQHARRLLLPSWGLAERKCFPRVSPASHNAVFPTTGPTHSSPWRSSPLEPCKGNVTHVSLPPLFFFFFIFLGKIAMNAHKASITKDYGLQFSVCCKVVLNDQMLMRREALLEE